MTRASSVWVLQGRTSARRKPYNAISTKPTLGLRSNLQTNSIRRIFVELGANRTSIL